MSKKGSAIIGGITLIVVLFLFALTAFIVQKSFIEPINDEIQADANFDADAKQIMADAATENPNYLDGLIIFIFVGLWISSLIFAYFVETHPLFLAVSIIGMIIVVMIGMIIYNLYAEIIADENLSGVESSYPKLHFMIQNLIPILVIYMFTVGAMLYAKR